MLKQRVLTAIALLAVLLPAVFYPHPFPFAVLAGILIAAAAWEWGRLNQCTSLQALCIGALCGALCAASWAMHWVHMPMRTLWLVAGAAWVAASVALLYGGVSKWAQVPRSVRLVGGVLALWVAWLAVVQARVVGINFLFSILCIAWVADVCAYFFGKALGGRFVRRKLAPAISPGKTWEGVCGGVAGVLLMAFVWRAWEMVGAMNATAVPVSASLYRVLGDVAPWLLVLGLVFLVAMSVVGDLMESLFKRSAGVKDSSALLPGHGGVLDRIDALLPLLPLAMMLSNVGGV